MHLTRFLILFLILISTDRVQSSPGSLQPYVLGNEMQGESIGLYSLILPNPDGQVQTIAQAFKRFQQGDGRASLQKTPNFGMSGITQWARFRLQNPFSTPIEIVIENDFGMTDVFELYEITPDGRVLNTYRGGETVDFSLRAYDVRTINFKLTLEPGIHDYIASTYSPGPLQLPLKIWTPDNFQTHHRHDMLLVGILLGFHLVVIGYNLFLYLSFKDQTYLYYLFFVVCNVIYHICNIGFFGFVVFESFGKETISNYYMLFAVDGIIISSVSFSRRFLNTRTNCPKMDKILVLSQLLSLFNISVLYYFALHLASIMTVVNASLVVNSLILCGLWTLKARYKPALYYLTAWGAYLFGSSGVIFLNFAFFETNPFLYWGQFVGGALEVVLFSIALGARVNHIQKQSENSIRELNRQLQERDEYRTRFFHNISHELRTPLNGIIGFADLLILGHFGKVPESADKQLHKIRELAQGLKYQITAILDLARSKRGKLELIGRPVDLDLLAAEMQILAEGLKLNYKHATFTLSKSWQSGKAPNYINDEDKLKTILRNILGNAFKFYAEGRPNHVRLSLEITDQNSLRVTVSDTGEGISPHLRTKIFEEFARGSFEAREGSGIGLALVKDVVKLMGGDIQVVDNGVDHGSQFEVILPCQQLNQNAVVQQESSRHEVNPSNGTDEFVARAPQLMPLGPSQDAGKILIVDDNETNLQVFEAILRGFGYETILARNGSEGMEQVRETSPDLILLDLMMPIMSGTEVLSKLKKDSSYSDIPVIVLTARASREDLIEAFLFGADDYLSKPIESSELLLRVRNTLTRIRDARKVESLSKQEKLAHLGEMIRELAHELRNSNSWGAETLDNEKQALRRLLDSYQLQGKHWDLIAERTFARQIARYQNRNELIIPSSLQKLRPQLSQLKFWLCSIDVDDESAKIAWKELLQWTEDRLLRVADAVLITNCLLSLWESAARSLQVIDSILSYSKESRQSDLSLDRELSHALTLLKPKLSRSKVTVNCQISIDQPIKANPSEIGQVLVNILRNAIEALEKSTVTSRQIKIEAEKRQWMVQIKISDNAGGLDPKLVEKIFEPNFSTKGDEGNGIGLFVSRRLITRQQGSIRAETLDGWTTFIIELPLDDQAVIKVA